MEMGMGMVEEVETMEETTEEEPRLQISQLAQYRLFQPLSLVQLRKVR